MCKPHVDLPYRPIWTGLLINLAVWSTVSALVLTGLVRLRAAHRRRRARCVRCNYPRAGLAPDAACPECGNTR